MYLLLAGFAAGAIVFTPLGGLLGYWLAACVIAGKALAGE